MNREDYSEIAVENNLASIHNNLSICNKFSNLLANTSELKTCSYDNSDSDDPFEDIKSCKNITFSRSRSCLDDSFQLMQATPLKSISTGKENKLTVSNSKTSRNENTNDRILLSHNKNSSENVVSKSRSCMTLNVTSEAQNKNGYFSYPIEHNVKVFNFCKNDTKVSQDLLSKSQNSSILDNSNSVLFNSSVNPKTPLASKLCQNSLTPLTYKSNTPRTSAFKRYSLMKAAIEAKKDYEEMLKTASLKKSNKKKNERNNVITNNSPLVSLRDPTKKDVSIRTKSTCDSETKKLVHQTFITSPNSEHYESPVCGNILDTTPVTEFSKIGCYQSSLKKQSFIKRVTNLTEDVINTPLSIRIMNSSTPITGVKQLHKSTSKTMSNNSSSSHVEIGIGCVEEDDDLPCTQPVSSTILRDVVAYVEVRSGKDCRSSGVKAELQSLGAKVENNFTRKVTHCFFYGGKMSTYRRAIEWKIPLVSTLWIEECKEELRMVPLKGFEPYGLDKYKEALPLYKLKTKGTKPQIKRPVTDSKILSKPWKNFNNEQDKAGKLAETNNQQVLPSSETDKVIDALHSVAGDLRKAADQFEQILTSPILQKGNKASTTNVLEGEKNGESIGGKKKRNKKLIFPETNKEKSNESLKVTNGSCDFSLVLNCTDDSGQEIRVSYDSDDLLAYAKKQAVNPRCSAPARLLTSRKCKKLLSSCHKVTNLPDQKNEGSSINNMPKLVENASIKSPTSKKNVRRSTRIKNADAVKRTEIHNNGLASKPKPKKRKLLMPLQVITTFDQDSGESTPDLSPLCPYRESPNKKPKTILTAKSKMFKAVTVMSSSDAESEDSLTRAARRESSALFIKKQKKVTSKRNLPTVVCTSLHRSDVDLVTSIVSKLGKFTVEATVSELTTHVVTCAPRRTINLLKGIARGCWVLDVQWVYESLEAGKWLYEERFELTKFSPSVKQARVERQAFGPEFSLELFHGVGPLYVCRTTVPPAADLIELLRLCGGSVVSSARAAHIVIGSSSPLSPVTHRSPLVVSEKWILDCITRLTQLSPYDYIASDSEP